MAMSTRVRAALGAVVGLGGWAALMARRRVQRAEREAELWATASENLASSQR